MHKDINTKREREKAVVSEMIALYCRRQHGKKNALCPECAALAAYARQRRQMPVYGDKDTLLQL